MWQPRLGDPEGPGEEGEAAIALLPGTGCALLIWKSQTWGSEKYAGFFLAQCCLDLISGTAEQGGGTTLQRSVAQPRWLQGLSRVFFPLTPMSPATSLLLCRDAAQDQPPLGSMAYSTPFHSPHPPNDGHSSGRE